MWNLKNKEYKGEEIKNIVIPAIIVKNKNITDPIPTPNYIPEQYTNYECPCTYIPLCAPDEIFLPISIDNVVPNRYYISNYGRIFSLYNNEFMSPYITQDGYLRLSLSNINGGSKKMYFVHRLVMMTFFPIDNPDQYQVNHKNGCTWCNWLCNLEWTTPIENIHHMYNELCPEINAITVTREKAEEVAKLIQDISLSLKTIAEMTGVSYANVRNIACGTCHTDVYYQYGLDKITRRLPEESLHDIFNLYSQGYQAYEIAKMLNIPKSTVTGIVYNDNKHVEIRSQYDLSNTYKPTRFTEEDIRLILDLYSMGHPQMEIVRMLGLNRSTVQNIVSGVNYPEIYKEYDMSNAKKHRYISPELVKEIRYKYENEGYTLTKLKNELGINISTISDIVKYRTHTDVV